MTFDFAHRSDIQGFTRILAVAVEFVCIKILLYTSQAMYAHPT